MWQKKYKKISVIVFFFGKRNPIMVKCLNIRKNIGKPIYRSISSRDTQSKLQTITVCICGIVLHHQHFQNHQVQQWADCFRWSCDESRFGFKKLVKPRLHWCVSGLFDSMKRPGPRCCFPGVSDCVLLSHQEYWPRVIVRKEKEFVGLNTCTNTSV